MRKCDNCVHGKYILNCDTNVNILYCKESKEAIEVQQDYVCDCHRFIDGYEKSGVLGYDCDGNEINEFRILRFPFSENIENWDEEPEVDSRFYCLIISSTGETLAVSVYDDWSHNHIRKREDIDVNDPVPMIIKPVSEMECYEVAFNGITGDAWYYDRNKEELRKK